MAKKCHFFRVGFSFFKLGNSLLNFFIFKVRKFCFLKYKSSIFPKFTSSFPLRKYKKFFRGFRFLKYKTFSRAGFSLFFKPELKSGGSHFHKKSFLLRKHKISLILELESFISWIIRNFFRGGFFLIFWACTEKCTR